MAHVKAWSTQPIRTLYIDGMDRWIGTRLGRFFLEGMRLEKSRTESIHYPQSSSQRSHSEFRPYIPPLPLSDIPRYNMEEQIAENKMLLSLYRDEAKRTTRTPRFTFCSYIRLLKVLHIKSPPTKGSNSPWLNRLFIHASFLMKLAYRFVDLSTI